MLASKQLCPQVSLEQKPFWVTRFCLAIRPYSKAAKKSHKKSDPDRNAYTPSICKSKKNSQRSSPLQTCCSRGAFQWISHENVPMSSDESLRNTSSTERVHTWLFQEHEQAPVPSETVRLSASRAQGVEGEKKCRKKRELYSVRFCR